MSRPHLLPALLAVLIVGAALLGGHSYIWWLENRYAHVLAPPRFAQKNQGIGLQRAAFRQPDLLPLYGSSELRDTDIFRSYPTGFNTSQVGKAGASALTYLQHIAAVGEDLRGKKVVISFTPADMQFAYGISQDNYAANFSRLHANELIFGTDLSLGLRQDAARRMRQFPKTLKNDPLLKFGIDQLAAGSPTSMALYYAALPLGKLQNLVLELQDDWEMALYFQTNSKLNPDVPHQAKALNWPMLAENAAASYRSHSNNNPYGLDNDYWKQNAADLIKQGQSLTDAKFLNELDQSQEWVDLELLLRALHELGARSLLISTPIPGPMYDYLGVSPAARSAYYKRLETLAEAYGVPVLDWADYADDKAFIADRWSHPSEKAWVLYQQAIDAFYHSRGDELSVSSLR